MSLDDLPPLAPTMDPRGKGYAERVVARARAVIASSRCVIDVPYRTDDYWQKLDVFMPEGAGKRDLPVFCFLHGGGWYTGHKEWVTFMAPAVIAAPALFVTPSYRHAPAARFPAQLDDCADAIAWVHGNIARFGGDPNRIHLGGHSAGAHLAALTALRRDVLARRGLPADVVKACHAVSGRYDLGRSSAEGAGAAPVRGGQSLIAALLGADGDAAAASPSEQTDGNRTPFSIAVGTEDLAGFLDQARALRDALRRQPCTVRYNEYLGYDHFMMSERCSQVGHEWMRGVHDWLRALPSHGARP
jgi:acetyl esterase/lipase